MSQEISQEKQYNVEDSDEDSDETTATTTATTGYVLKGIVSAVEKNVGGTQATKKEIAFLRSELNEKRMFEHLKEALEFNPFRAIDRNVQHGEQHHDEATVDVARLQRVLQHALAIGPPKEESESRSLFIVGKYFKSKESDAFAYMEKHCSLTFLFHLPLFKPVSLSLSRI